MRGLTFLKEECEAQSSSAADGNVLSLGERGILPRLTRDHYAGNITLDPSTAVCTSAHRRGLWRAAWSRLWPGGLSGRPAQRGSGLARPARRDAAQDPAIPLIFFAILDALIRISLPFRQGIKLLGICLVNVCVAMTISLVIMNTWQPGLPGMATLMNC